MMQSTEFKVGLFVLACLGIVAAMSFQVNNDPSMVGRAQHYAALVTDASGIVKNSNVKMAGINVGIIRDIILEDNKAKILMKIRGGIKITEDASVELKPNGILGDKYVELYPGDQTKPQLPENSVITNVKDKGSFDAVLNQVGKIASDLGDISQTLKKATTGEGDESSPVGRIIHNIEDLTADLKDISGDEKDKIEETIDNIHRISKNLDDFINDESDDGFKRNWKKMAKSLGRVDSILRNVDEITAKINSGKGTIGRLINDETTVEEINHAVAGVNNMIDTANKFQINVDYHSEFLGGGAFVKSYVGINIQPGPDRYYLFQVIDDPKGSYDAVSTAQSVGGGPPTTSMTQNIYHNKLKFSAEFAKSFYDLTLRAGVIEDSGGAGIDYYFFNKKLKLSAEAFGFARPEGVDIRAYARYKFYSIFYAVVGGDDIFNRGGNFSGTGPAGFIGAGLDFNNDDLKLLLSKVPF